MSRLTITLTVQTNSGQASPSQSQPQSQAGASQTTPALQGAVPGIAVRGAANGERTITIPDNKGGETRIHIGQDGITINGEKIGLVGDQTAQQLLPPPPPGIGSDSATKWDIPDNVVAIFAITAAVVMVVRIASPLVKTLARWMEKKISGEPVAPDVTARLLAIEQAVESVAVEVERISEGQRFTTRILADRAGLHASALSSANSPLTPPVAERLK